MRHVLTSSRLAVSMLLAISLSACGERDYEEPKVETTVEIEPSVDGNVGGGGSPNSGDATANDETDIRKLIINFTVAADDSETGFVMVPAAVEEEAVLLLPRGGSAVTIPYTPADVTNLSFIFEVNPAHSFPRTLDQITATLDTYYLEAGSTEEQLYTLPLHDVSAFTWQALNVGYGHGYAMKASGFQAFNDEFSATRTIRSQYLTFLMTSQANLNQALIATVPIVVGQ